MQASRFLKIALNTIVVVALLLTLSACIKETSEDADIFEDAGTSSGSAIVLDPDED